MAADTIDQAPIPAKAGPSPRLWQRLLGLALVIGISVALIVWRREIAGFRAYGYPGLFLVNLIGNATLFLPAPMLVVVFAAGSSFLPPLVGLAAGSGAALGELTGYLAGFSGGAIVEDQAQYVRMQGWMQRWGVWVIFILSLVPNPLFDLAGITAGALRVPVWRFLLACWAGKVLKMTIVAYMGGHAVGIFQHWLAH